ncbi:MAG: hypothetical protein WCT52_00720 [Candidatus Micrarchaeia archaeon]
MAHKETSSAGGNPAKGEWKHPAAAFAGQAGRQWNLWFLPLGLIGPIIGTAVWMAMIVIGLWILKIMNMALQSALVTMLVGAVLNNLQWFLAFSLAIGYLDFFSRRFQPAGIYLFPFSNALGATFSAWIVAWIFRAIGTMAGVSILFDIGMALRANLLIVFAVFLVLGALAIDAHMKSRRDWHG